MTRSTQRLILLLLLATGLVGCYHRPYYHDDRDDSRRGYGYGYNHFPSTSILLRGSYQDNDRHRSYGGSNRRHVPLHDRGRKEDKYSGHNRPYDSHQDRSRHQSPATKRDRKVRTEVTSTRSRRHDSGRIKRPTDKQTRGRNDSVSEYRRGNSNQRRESKRQTERRQNAGGVHRSSERRQRRQSSSQAVDTGGAKQGATRSERHEYRVRKDADTRRGLADRRASD